MIRLNRFYMLAGIAVLVVVLIVGFQTSVLAVNITYTSNYANAGDTPVFGTMIDPSDYYYGDERGGGGASGSSAKPYGDALDQKRVYIWDWGYPGGTFQMMKWDMGFKTNFVRVYPDCENGWQPPNGRDYLEWSLWGSNSPDENSGAWTLLWDPTAGSGTSVNDLVATTVNGSALSAKVYRYGTNLDVGTVPGDAYSDAFTIELTLADSYRYFGIRASTIAANEYDPDPEINAVASAMEVEIDIKPGSYPNSINPDSKGVIPVAILTTPQFDATTVDPLSVEFGPGKAKETHGKGHIEDVDGDCDMDLVLHFNTQDTGIKSGDTTATLNGKTFAGQAITGTDSISTVPPKKAPSLRATGKLIATWASIKAK